MGFVDVFYDAADLKVNASVQNAANACFAREHVCLKMPEAKLRE